MLTISYQPSRALRSSTQHILHQSREWVTQSDPWPKWPIDLLTHDPCDPWPMGHRGRHPILAQALHRFYRLPGTVFGHCICTHTPLSCYIIAHVSKLLAGFLWSPYVIGQTIIFLPCNFFLLSYLLLFYSSPNLSGRRLDVYHTLTHGVALVRI